MDSHSPPTRSPVPARPSRLWPLTALALGLALIAAVTFLVITLSSAARLSSILTPTQSFTVSGPTVAHVQALSLLTVQNIHIVSELEAEASFRKGTWIVRGEADYAVDFSKAELISRDEAAKLVTIRLPSPTLRNPRLDEQRTRLVTLENTGLGWWSIGALGSRDQFERTSRPRLQEAVVAAARDPQFLPAARESAERLVRSMLQFAGWRIDVQWGASPVEPPAQATPVRGEVSPPPGN